VSLALGFVWAAGAAVAEEPPAALVMSVSGNTTPAVSPMSEIASGAPIKLEPGAELTLLDYARCKMVTVSGGTATVTRFDFSADGKIVTQVDVPCPRIHQLSAAAGGTVAGGLVMRGLGSVPRWPLNRQIDLVGNGADKLKAASMPEADARAIGFDLIFSYAANRFPGLAANYDREFLAALFAAHGKVVLARSAGAYPAPPFVAAMFDPKADAGKAEPSAIAFAELTPNADGVFRDAAARVDTAESTVATFAPALLARAKVQRCRRRFCSRRAGPSKPSQPIASSTSCGASTRKAARSRKRSPGRSR
jgi:hypothetical protein